VSSSPKHAYFPVYDSPKYSTPHRIPRENTPCPLNW